MTQTLESPTTDTEYREVLLSLRDKLMNEVTNIYKSNMNSPRSAGEELADIGSDNFTRETGLSVMSEEALQLKKIDDALKRIENGTFGKCLDTGKSIQPKRLKAIPYAKRCIEAQEEYEKKVAMGIIQKDR